MEVQELENQPFQTSYLIVIILYIETGSHYRALTYMLLKKELSPDSVEDYLSKKNLVIEEKINKNKSEIQIDGIKFNREGFKINKSESKCFPLCSYYLYSENYFSITRDHRLIWQNRLDFRCDFGR